MRAIHAILASVTIAACDGSSAPPAAEPSTPTSTPASGESRDPQDPTPAAAAPSDEPVSWTFFEPTSIDRDGVVTMGGRVRGTLSARALVGPDGTAIASVDAEGYVSVEVGDDDERVHIEHLRPERIADVLLVSSAALAAMAAAFQH